MYPNRISINENNELMVEWDDRSVSSVPLITLRKFCPCAVCASEREMQISSYIPLLFADQTKIIKIKSVGKYAINIIWADGHTTGIYEFSFLKKLSQNVYG